MTNIQHTGTCSIEKTVGQEGGGAFHKKVIAGIKKDIMNRLISNNFATIIVT